MLQGGGAKPTSGIEADMKRKHGRKARWDFSAADASRIGRRVLESAKTASPSVASQTVSSEVDAPPAKAKPRPSPPAAVISSNAATLERFGSLYGGAFSGAKPHRLVRDNAGHGVCRKLVTYKMRTTGDIVTVWVRVKGSRPSRIKGGKS